MNGQADTTRDAQTIFRRAETNAEGLIAWLRLAISTTLVLSFAVAIGAAEQTLAEAVADSNVRRMQFVYALATMAAYFALGTICLVLIHFQLFRSWMVWPTAAGDCLFILSGIWLGLQNTGLTGDYIVVLPTLWLIPVVLATGVLRFNPRVQTFIIVLLIGGLWGIDQTFPTLGHAPREAMDVFFAQPPNIMRLVMIALAGLVVIVATWRMRALFLRALQENQRRVNLTRYVPSEVAPELAQTGLQALQDGARQNVAVMFVDIRGFTSRAETLSPDALSRFITQYRGHVTQAARAKGGIVDKFIGDAVMLIFSSVREMDTPGARAVSCGEDILERVHNWPEQTHDPVDVGIGIHYGEVFAGVIGDDDRLEYSVFGDAVNIAARLEELTKSTGMEMVVSHDLLMSANLPIAGWQKLPEVTLRGRRAALAVYGQNTEKTGAEDCTGF